MLQTVSQQEQAGTSLDVAELGQPVVRQHWQIQNETLLGDHILRAVS